MKDNQLIYIAFGSETYQIEAVFSISSAIARSQETPDFLFDINVYTDNPGLYKNLPVKTHPIKKEWYGDINYHFRLKPAVVYDNTSKYRKSILIDTDTFFKKSPKHLFDKITEKNLLCNSKHPEANISLDSNVLDTITNEDLLRKNFIYLNSGVIGIHKKSSYLLEETIKIIDSLYPKLSYYYTLEELALALAVSLNNIESVGCTEIIHHYWSRKAIFRKKAETWYAKYKNNPCSNNALLDTLNVTVKVPKPPAISRLINKLIALTVEKKYRQFILELFNATHQYKNEFDNAAATVWIQKSFENLKIKNPNITQVEVDSILKNKLISTKTKNIKINLSDFFS
ncbi:MAG: hypothetical protein M0Q29_06805 [Thiopseudomonas sp.]|nr:hypothetical protein [Thiopseudomonas sp.]MCK9465580.1 hypothetical protein [Thiopseudomonas sp.]